MNEYDIWGKMTAGQFNNVAMMREEQDLRLSGEFGECGQGSRAQTSSKLSRMSSTTNGTGSCDCNQVSRLARRKAR